MLVFSIESSCDETSVCIMNNEGKIFSHITYTQEIHQKHGGVVPELASRSHLEILQNITKKALRESDLKLKDFDIFSATCGPGLIGGLLVGSTFAKSLSIGVKKPFIPINHLEAHVLSPSYNNKIEFPHLSFLLTGGHTQIYLSHNIEKIELLGETIDDAIGEAFDKVAKILGLPYPGGHEVEKKALKGDENTFTLPKPLLNERNLNFSFSGLKTSINLITKKNTLNNVFINNMCASFQKCISEILSSKLEKAIDILKKRKHKISSLSVVGGVANNQYLKNSFKLMGNKHKINILLPPDFMMSDNAAMIAWATILKYNKTNKDIYFKPNPRLVIS